MGQVLRALAVGAVLVVSTQCATASEASGPDLATQCEAAAKERDALKASGIEKAIARGPDAVKKEGDPALLERIRRYIALEEEVLFKCPVGPPMPKLTVAGRRGSSPPPLPERRPATVPYRPKPKPASDVLVPLPVRRGSVF